MTEAIFNRDQIRARLNKYTSRAFKMLPPLKNPKILDIGCGTGEPTLMLAKHTDGEIIGIDIDQSALDQLNKKIKEAGLEERVKVVNKSMLQLDFEKESFNIIWAEGSIFRVGFETGLKEWKELIKPGGFLAVHDEKGDVDLKIKQIKGAGFELIGHFILSSEIWWEEYFKHLQVEIDLFKQKYGNDPEALKQIGKDLKELDMFEANPERNTSIFFVMKKIN